jgi:polyphosphate kinase
MTYLSDNTQAWVLEPSGTYRRCTAGAHKPRSAQQGLLEALCD